LGDFGDEYGPKGLKGPIGPTSTDKGLKGPIGRDNLTKGAKGPKGDIGPVLVKNGPGDQGPTGPRGNKGPKGPIGRTGPTGPIGGQGPLGPKGPRGAQGVQGPQGPASDKRVKNNIKSLKGNLSKLKNIRGVKFTWKGGTNQRFNIKGNDIGFIAQEINQVIPDVVFTGEDGFLRLEYGKLVAVGIGSLQEQHTRITQLKERINILKSKVLNG